MFKLLQIVAILLVAVAMGLALSLALELPGKRRLPRESYVAVQPIYTPGFAIGGAVGEIGGLSAILLLLLLTPADSPSFWLTLAAFLALAAMHAVYWLLTHPVNNFWLEDFELKGAGAASFRADPLHRTQASASPDWTALRDRWEYSHVIRAGFGLLSLTLLAAAAVF